MCIFQISSGGEHLTHMTDQLFPLRGEKGGEEKAAYAWRLLFIYLSEMAKANVSFSSSSVSSSLASTGSWQTKLCFA